MRPRTDFKHAKTVEITISHDGKKVWVDVDGMNRFRVYNAQLIVITDRRPATKDQKNDQS